MKLVVLQCADAWALKRGWAHPDPHNVITLDDAMPRRDTLDGAWSDDQPADEVADDAGIGG